MEVMKKWHRIHAQKAKPPDAAPPDSRNVWKYAVKIHVQTVYTNSCTTSAINELLTSITATKITAF